MIFVEILGGCVFLLFFLVFLLSLGFRNPRKPHEKTPAGVGLSFREVRVPTANDRRLYGWWIPAPNAATVHSPTIVLVHGWGRNVERMLPYIEHLHPVGYNLLAFDARNHGSSDPDKYMSMLKFAEDIQSAVSFVAQEMRGEPEQIGVLGLSVGGAAAIYAAAHDPRIAGVVTVGAFAHPAEIMRLAFAKWHIPYFPVVWLLFKYIEFRIGARLDAIAPAHNIGKARAGILLIQGEKDVVVPAEQGRKLHAAADSNRTRLWLLPERGHSDCHLEPQFWPTLDTFFRETLAQVEAT